MTENYQPIPHRLKNMAVGGHVAGAEDIDAGDGKTQQEINADTYRKAETYSKEQLDNMITTPEQKYENYTAEDGDTFSDLGLPAEGEADTTYRVGSWDGTEYNASKFSEYSWDGTQYILLSVQSPGIDDEPTAESSNLVESDGTFIHVQERGKLLYKGAWLYENHVVSHRTGVDHTLVANTSFDLLVFEIPNNASAFELQGITGGVYDLWPSDDLSLWEGNYFLSSSVNNIRKYPTAKYVSVGINKSNNSTAAAEKYANVIPLWTNDIDKSASCGSMNFINSDAVAKLAAKKRLSSVEGTHEDGYVNIAGVVSEVSDYCHYLFSTEVGKTYHVHIPSFLQSSDLYYTVYFLKEIVSAEKYNVEVVEGTGIIANVPTTIDIDVTIPADAIGLVAISRDSATGVPTCWEVEIQDTQSYVEETLAPTEALLAKNAVAMSELTLMEPDAVEVGKFMQDSGAIGTNASFSINKYNVTPGKVYTFSGKHSASVGIKFLAWMDSYDNIIKWEPYGGVSVQYIDQPVIAPIGAAQAWFNSQPSGYPDIYNFKSVGEPISVRELLTNTGELVVTKIGNDVYVRTAFNATKDIIQHYTQDANKCMKPYESWIGNSSDTNADIMADANKFHVWGDSNAPIYCTTHLFSPWHLFGNHGLRVPCVKTVEAELTTDDEGSIWKDYYTNKTFILGKVVVNDANPYVVLIPTVTESATQGIYTWSWYYNDDLPTKLVYVSGEAIHTDDVILNGARASNFQISPVLESVNRKFLCDGSEIKDDGTYRCAEFTITETLIGLNPATVTTWYPSPVRESEMVRFTYNYTFSGLGTRFDVGIDVKYPICCDFFGGNQAQHTLNIEGYDIYVFAPRSKKQVGGHATDVPFKNNPSDQSSRSIVCSRNTSDCYDVDKMPDRLVSYLQDSSDDSKLIGFASGLSLTRGITKDAERKNYIPVGSLCYNNSIGQGNKMYIVAISSDTYENHLLPTSLIGNISSYFSYYDPNANEGQVYWYKDGKDYVIYAHYQSAQTKTPVNLPMCMEGLSVEIVDKTAGVTLLTDMVENGKVYINATNESNNYIVLKTK